MALVGAIMQGQAASMNMSDPKKREAAKKADEDAKAIALESATKLVVTLLCDIHRIADALEYSSGKQTALFGTPPIADARD